MKTISNNKLTLLRKLGRKKYRQKNQLFIVEGPRGVQQIIENGSVEVKALLFDQSQTLWSDEYWNKQASEQAVWKVEKADFQAISDTNNPQGVTALCGMPAEADFDRMSRQSGVTIATDAIQDPGNMGTIIRTATWFGVSGLLVGKGSVDIFHPKTVRSTAGATGVIPYQTGALTEILSEFEQAGWQTALLDLSDESKSVRQIDRSTKTIVVIGNEANGINPEIRSQDRQSIHIPSGGNQQSVESLNAAISLSIALYELC